MRHLIGINDFSVKELDDMINLAKDIIDNPNKYSEACKGKKLATLFYEPSTRTRLSFESAMIELGGNVIGFSDASNSSVSKGESVADTAKVISCFADICAMRHNKEGAPLIASFNASIPVINAGDGGHNHPTQTLTDMLTIACKKGRFENLNVGLCGDLKYGRTVHSLIEALSRYKGVNFILISPKELVLPDYVKETLDKNNLRYEEITDLERALPNLDILYMTRIQRERFSDKDEYERLKNSYVLTKAKLKNAKADLCILHPLPRVNEISVDVDSDERACYFEQVLYGKYIRMALILTLLDKKEEKIAKTKSENYIYDKTCTNEKCITSIEQELPHVAIEKEGVYRCLYCEHVVK